MRTSYLLSCWVLLAAGLAGSGPTQAQHLLPTSRQAFDYMQLTVLESTNQQYAKMLFSPSFQAQSEVRLEALDSSSDALNEYSFRRNAEKVTGYLGDASAAGWELLEVHPAPYLLSSNVYTTRYLFRRPKS